jgi:hypothetical protein
MTWYITFFLVGISISFSISIRLTLFLLVSSLAIYSEYLLALHKLPLQLELDDVGKESGNVVLHGTPLYPKTNLALVAEFSNMCKVLAFKNALVLCMLLVYLVLLYLLDVSVF